jgi:glucose-6-phosphate 1-dehydrogenase
MTREELEKHISLSIQKLADDETQLKDFLQICSYHQGLYEKLDHIATVLNSIQTDHEDRIFYLGVPPELFFETAKRIHHVSK